MAGEIRYKILADLPITLVMYVGEIGIPQLQKHIKILGSDSIYNPSYNAITDFGRSNLKINQRELKQVADYFQNNLELVAKRKHAFIVNTPNQMALTSLFSMYSRLLPIEYNVMGSLPEALIYTGFGNNHFDLIKRSFEELADA